MSEIESSAVAGVVSQKAGPLADFEATVVSLEPVMGDASLVTLEAPPAVIRQIQPGSFFHVRCHGEIGSDPFLRRPFSIFSRDPDRHELVFLVRPFGRGSGWMAARSPGERINMIGPLGTPFSIAPRARNLLMVAGGVGVAPLVMLANDAVARGLEVVFLLGAANAETLLAPSLLPSEVEYQTTTIDGSQGRPGFVTALIPDYVRWADQVFACGPNPMLQSVRSVLEPLRIGKRPTAQVSVEREMACGFGACLGCVIETRRGWKTTCVDGPVFDMDDLVW